MNIKPPLSLIALILCAATHTSAWAQSGTITFQGRIVAPVCSGTPIIHPSNAPGQSHPAIAMDNSGCDNSGVLIASTRLSGSDAPATQGLVRTTLHTGPVQGSLQPLVTITYH